MCFFLCTFAAQINTRVMNKIISKRFYSENVAEFVVEAPLIARSRKAGHFVMVRVDKHSERMPLTISAADVEKGTITLVVQRIGVSSSKLCALDAGDVIVMITGLVLFHDIEQSLIAYSGYSENIDRSHYLCAFEFAFRFIFY